MLLHFKPTFRPAQLVRQEFSTAGVPLPDASAYICYVHSERTVRSPRFFSPPSRPLIFCYAIYFVPSSNPTTFSTGLGHAANSNAVQWIRSACPDAEQLDPFYAAQGHEVDIAPELHREAPQSVTEGGYLALKCHADKMHTE